jgi:hypothetical protein
VRFLPWILAKTSDSVRRFARILNPRNTTIPVAKKEANRNMAPKWLLGERGLIFTGNDRLGFYIGEGVSRKPI